MSVALTADERRKHARDICVEALDYVPRIEVVPGAARGLTIYVRDPLKAPQQHALTSALVNAGLVTRVDGKTLLYFIAREGRSTRVTDRSLYQRAKDREAAGKPLNYAERQRLELARARRVEREDASFKKDHSRALNASDVGPTFRMTRRGWRIVIPNDHPGGPWSAKDELEVVTRGGVAKWVTLVRLWFTGSDHRCSQWWSFVDGRQSQVVFRASAPVSAPPPPPALKRADEVLTEDDEDRVESIAGRAYLAAAKKRRAEASR